MRSHSMAVLVLVRRIYATGNDDTRIEEVKNPTRKDGEQGWQPNADGGVRPEYVLLRRGFFQIGRAAPSLALTILDAVEVLLRRVPMRLKDHIRSVVADLSDAGLPSNLAGVRLSGEVDNAPEADDWESDGEPEGDYDFDMEDVQDEDTLVVYTPPVHEWVEHVLLRLYAKKISEPVLADTGGAGRTVLASKCILPLLTECH